MSKAAEGAMQKIEARHAAERAKARAEDATPPRPSYRKLTPWRQPTVTPVPMKGRYEQR
jgi:hypothetical protein